MQTRRHFLLLVLGIGAAACARPAKRHARQGALGQVLDELIPAGDGMPSATEAGSLGYLERLARDHPEVATELDKSLAELDKACRRRFGAEFVNLPRARRVAALTWMEKESAREDFTKLRGYVYEAYYTRPEVWKLIGYLS